MNAKNRASDITLFSDILHFSEHYTYVLTLHCSCATIAPEAALDVLIAADMLNLPRLIQLAETALEPVRSSDLCAQCRCVCVCL